MEINLEKAFEFFQERKRLIESNIITDEEELKKRSKLAKERGIKEPIIIPEGYMDRDKDLREGIKISKQQLETCEDTIKDIQKLISLSF